MGLGTGHTYTGNAVLCWGAAGQRLLYSRPLRALPDAKISRLMSGCACMVVWGHIIRCGALPLQGIGAKS